MLYMITGVINIPHSKQISNAPSHWVLTVPDSKYFLMAWACVCWIEYLKEDQTIISANSLKMMHHFMDILTYIRQTPWVPPRAHPRQFCWTRCPELQEEEEPVEVEEEALGVVPRGTRSASTVAFSSPASTHSPPTWPTTVQDGHRCLQTPSRHPPQRPQPRRPRVQPPLSMWTLLMVTRRALVKGPQISLSGRRLHSHLVREVCFFLHLNSVECVGYNKGVIVDLLWNPAKSPDFKGSALTKHVIFFHWLSPHPL